ncbi:MFS transporter [Paludisphaera rhizosphaerae]|uniref:MFS transporter n=1 Tax=Paludisphaera rhizosphaerae TaxID=2711216 RepID=UPI0013EA53A0|nr:MFS transporter [Paludisphaera rhizosphaerae]
MPSESSYQHADALDRARTKAYRRLLPLLFICYVVAYIDRTNVGFAKLTMEEQLGSLGFSEKVFGFGMGVFFIGYLLLEIPGSVLVERWSARKWIFRIMVSWGIVASMTAFVHKRVPGVTNAVESVTKSAGRALEATIGGGAGSYAEALQGPGAAYIGQFFSVRFLLGLAEAGFFPGVIVYLSHWFPRRDRSRALAWFLIAAPLSQIIGPKICDWMMKAGDGVAGLVGWQWIFLLWGLPAVILGFVVLFFLTDRPAQASWLTPEEREALQAELDAEKAAHPSTHFTIAQALAHPKVLLLALAFFLCTCGNYAVEMQMPSILKDWYKLSTGGIALLLMIPPVGSLLGQLFVGWNSDRTAERRWHASLPIVLGAVAMALIPFSHGNVVLSVLGFTVALIGFKAYLPAFWTLPGMFLTESAAAASIGFINSIANLGGWVGPTLVGVLKQNTNSYDTALWILSGFMIVAATIIANIGVGRRQTAPVETPEPSSAVV